MSTLEPTREQIIAELRRRGELPPELADPKVSGFDEGSFIERAGTAAVNVLPETASAVGGISGALLTGGNPAGGAAGAALGYGAGEVIQRYIKDEPVVDQQLFLEMAQEAALDVTGAKAAEMFSDAYRALSNSEFLSKLNPLEGQPTNFLKKQSLQKRLQEFSDGEAGLTLNQLLDQSRIVQGITGVGESAFTTSQVTQVFEKVQGDYLSQEVGKLLKYGRNLKGRQLGQHAKEMVTNLREQTEAQMDKLFLDLYTRGSGKKISLLGARNQAKALLKKYEEGATGAAKEGYKKGKKPKLMPSELKNAVDGILELSPDVDFNTAYDKLKLLKKMANRYDANPETKDVARQVNGLVRGYEASMLKSLGKTDPELVDQYKALMESYSGLMSVTYSDVAMKIMDKSPTLAGRMLFTGEGALDSAVDFQDIIDLAQKTKGVSGAKPMMRGLQSAWFRNVLKGTKIKDNPLKAMEDLREARANNAELFDFLMDDTTKKNFNRILEDFDIMTQNISKEGSLVIRSQQASGLRQAASPESTMLGRFSGFVASFIPSKIPEIITNQERVNKLLKLNKMAIKLDELARGQNLTRLEKENMGRLQMSFVQSLNSFSDTFGEFEQDALLNEYQPKLDRARRVLSGGVAQEDTIESVPE